MADHFRFAPQILERLGEELVPHADLGIIELVRNAYDADASRCSVALSGITESGGEIIIRDDGDGMDLNQIRSGWLLLGKSSKRTDTLTRLGRRRVGEKGLGRLSALRLGNSVTLKTTPRSQDTLFPMSHVLTIDWAAYDKANTVEDVPLQIQSVEGDAQSGTEIRITGLRRPMRPIDVKRLARSLVLLSGPFPAANAFEVALNSPEFNEYQDLVSQGYFTEADYILRAQVRDGRASASLIDWRGVVLSETQILDRSGSHGAPGVERHECPDADLEIYEFNLSKEAFGMRSSLQSVGAVRQWLGAFGGVHIYQREMRVHPYGDPGHDWLDMNLRRVRSPEHRPSTNNSIGRMVILGNDETLVPKTDRMGFIESEAFLELRRFGQMALDWAASERIRIRDESRHREKEAVAEQIESATEEVVKTVSELPPELQVKFNQAIEKYQSAVGRKLRVVEDDLQLYRTLGTVGTTMAVFAHETARPVASIESVALILTDRIRQDLESTYGVRYQAPLTRLGRAAQSLRTFADVPLELLSRSKRVSGDVDINAAVGSVVNLFQPYLEEAAVNIELRLSIIPPIVSGTEAMIEAIIANLLANSVYFFGEAEGDRVIRVSTEISESVVFMMVSDSGPGIRGLNVAEIWQPGRTTREGGTGLGLTIVRDVVRDMHGHTRALSQGDLGGAEFTIQLPRARVESD